MIRVKIRIFVPMRFFHVVQMGMRAIVLSVGHKVLHWT